MKRSIYNRTVNLGNGSVAVYNTLTGALCVFDKNEYTQFFVEDISLLSDSEKEDMKEKTFFVSDDTDELSMVLLKREKQIMSSSVPTYRVLVTTACNAKCPYCFENGIKFLNMNTTVADALVDFILKEAEGYSKIKVQWFGGEPIMNLGIIEYITQKLNTRFNGDIVYSIITNGSLMTKNTVKKLLGLGVKRAQVTFDGDKSVYEETKNYIDKNITFESILENVKNALEEGMAVVVRLNYDKNNLNSIKDLIGKLGEKFCSYKNFSCYPYPIYGTYNGPTEKSTDKDDLLLLHTEIIKSGIVDIERLFSSALGVKTGPCMACNRKSFIILPSGELFKCSVDMKNNVGTVFDSVEYNKYFFEWNTAGLNEKCLSCNLLPVCQGGCRAGALGKLPVTCMRDKEIVDDIIKLTVYAHVDN